MDFRKCNREKVFRYSIRKYHFGAASVAVAALMFLGARASVVQADTTVNATEVSLESSEPKSDPAAEGASEASNGSERSADETSNSVQRTPVGSDRDASPSSNNGESSEGSDRSNSSAVSGSDRSAEETSNSGQHTPAGSERSAGEGPNTVSRSSQRTPTRRARSVGEDRASRLNGDYSYNVDQVPVPDSKINDFDYLFSHWYDGMFHWLHANSHGDVYELYTNSFDEQKIRRKDRNRNRRVDKLYRDDATTDSSKLNIFNLYPQAEYVSLSIVPNGGGEARLTVVEAGGKVLDTIPIPAKDLWIKQSEYDKREKQRQSIDKSALNAELGKESGTKESDKYQNADQAKRTAYDQALAAAKAVVAKEGASQAEVEKAKNDLVAAAAALNGQATSKDELKAEIAKEDATKADAKYTNADQAKRTAYDQALEAAKAVAAKEGASQAEVEKAKNDLVAAAAALNVSDIVAGTQPTSYQTRAMLPNTGIRSDNTTAALGLLSIFGAVGLLFSKKKKDDEEA
ncbi:FIVAR domain-containing protein [Streptococcus pseudopneumoniae]|uniref:YSIRK-type signal peptide-containing protein n=1 Tax=Streptococcus pseudopneumoniae TaxID=257758 RepID=UPI001C6CA0EE|nr:YSIRK-type signal peptide-containing protein [Streptococcus pseudopneumoniae]MBW8106752.1 FIVAR domain-containing protein [Streptococcus pseudopneumoniae]